MTPFFHSRADAGKVLASLLTDYAGRSDTLVLALPRGGVPVASEVARALDAPLDVVLVRKLGVPGQEELAMGAIASGGARVLNADVVQSLRLTEAEIDRIAGLEGAELARRERVYRQGRPPLAVSGQLVIVVDDGLATGATMRAAVRALRQRRPSGIVIAVPVAARETCAALSPECDQIVCARLPDPFFAVGCWYADFSQTTDAEVHDLLARTLYSERRPDPMNELEDTDETDDDTDETLEAQEVPLHEWAGFLQDFTRRHDSERATLEMRVTDTAGEADTIAEGLPLSGVAFDSADGEEGTIQILLGDTLTHVVEEPTYLWHYDTHGPDGEFLEIEDANGQTTRLRFE